MRLIEQRGWYCVPNDPREVPAGYRDILLAMRGHLVAQNLATDEEISALVQELEAAQGIVEFGTTTLQVEMIAEVP